MTDRPELERTLPSPALAEAGLTREVAWFVKTVSLDDVPVAVLDAAKRSILDGFGLAVAGSATTASEIARRMVTQYGCSERESSVLGSEERVPARFAAFLNGVSIHAHDFDDTQLAVAPNRVYGLLTHPTAPVLPAVLAISERFDLTGAELLISYLVGVELATKAAEAIDPRHYDEGFHSTANVGRDWSRSRRGASARS